MSELLEREREVTELNALAAAARKGAGSLVVIEAAAGLGKTRLLQAAREVGRRAGLRVLAARATELEHGFPFSLVRQLFAPALAALDAMGKPWRIAYTSSHMPGIHSAVNAGMAITILGISSIPKEWRRLGEEEGFPELPHLDIALVVPANASVATKRFATFLRETVLQQEALAA